MSEMLKRLLRNKMIPSVLSIVLGVVLIITRRAALDVLVTVMGWLLIVAAVSFVGSYLFGPFRDSMQLVTAVLIGLVGLFFVTSPSAIVNIFPVMMGIVLILNGLSNLAGSAAYRGGVFSTVMSVIIVVLGVLVLLHPGAMADAVVLYTGISFVVNGIFDLAMLHKVKSVLLDRTIVK